MESQSIHAFKASSVKLNLEQRLVPLLENRKMMGDSLSSERKEVLKRAIGILFSFQRKRIDDAGGAFVQVRIILKRFWKRYVDKIFSWYQVSIKSPGRARS